MSHSGKIRKREIKPAINKKMLDPDDTGKYICGPFFLVTLEEKDLTTKIPFLLSVNEEYVKPECFIRLIVFDYKLRLFTIIKVNTGEEFSFTNQSGHLKIHFKDNTFSVNQGKVINKGSNYVSGKNTASVNVVISPDLSELPSYYNKYYIYLVPNNFLINSDQTYVFPDSGVNFKGVVTYSEPELKMPSIQNQGDKVKFFTFSRCYLIFESSNVSFAVPTGINTSCTYDSKQYILSCKDGTVDYYYKLDKGLFGFNGFEAFSINVMRYRIVIGNHVSDVVDVAVSRLNGLYPPDVGNSAKFREGGDFQEENRTDHMTSVVDTKE